MAFYTQPQILLLVKLINESNPGLNYDPLVITNTRLGVPYPYQGERAGQMWDTTIEVFPRDASKFIGRALVHYRRIDLDRLFKHQPVRLDRWCDDTLTPAMLVEELNERFGTTFVVDDFPNTTWSSSTSIQSIQVRSSSLCYQGTLSLIWTQGKRALYQTLDTERLDDKGHYDYRELLLQWSNHPFDAREDLSKPLLTQVGFNIDYSPFYENLSGLVSGRVIDSQPSILNALNRFSQITGMNLDITLPHTEEGGLKGLTVTRMTLPNLNLAAEANGHRYRNVVAISALPNSWFRGRLLLHYNRVTLTIRFETLRVNELQSVELNYYEILTQDLSTTLCLTNVTDGEPYPTWGSQLTSTVPVDLSMTRQRYATPIRVGYDPSVTRETQVCLTLRQGSANGAIMGRSRPFTLLPWQGVNEIDVPTEMEFNVAHTFVVDNLPYFDQSLPWSLVGAFKNSIRGSVQTQGERAEIRVSIPLTEYVNGLRSFSLRINRPDGNQLYRTSTVRLASVTLERTDYDHTSNFSLPVQEGDVLVATLYGGGGGGSGNGTSADGNNRTFGAQGGTGQKIEYEGEVTRSGTLSGSVSPGGEGAPGNRQNGQKAPDTTLSLAGRIIARAIGGGGAYIVTGSAWFRNFYLVNRGLSPTPSGGGIGGLGSRALGHRGGPGSKGNPGAIKLTIFRKYK